MKKQNDPLFHCESLDAPIKEGEDTTLGEMIPAEESEACFMGVCESGAVKAILEQVEKVRGGMNQYCFLEYAYYDKSMADIARKIHVTPPAIKHHIRCAAEQLRENPVIKESYPERYEKKTNYISDYAHKGVGSFFSTGTSIVEDIVNRRIAINNKIKRNKERRNEKGKKEQN